MDFLDLTLPTFPENLALDEALLLAAEAGASGECLRLWEWPSHAVVLGAAGVLAHDVCEDACRRDGVPVGRRSSGGGTVLLGRGCLLFSLVLSFDRARELAQITPSYSYILGAVAAALSPAAGPVRLAGTSDLALGECKFSGNSQQRKRNHVLHHGTILYDFDLSAVARYLREPVRQPDYRRRRDHQHFIANLPIPKEAIADALRDAWGARTPAVAWPEAAVAELVAAKYARDEWVRRR